MIMQTPKNLQMQKKEVPPEWLSQAAFFTILPLEIELRMNQKEVRGKGQMPLCEYHSMVSPISFCWSTERPGIIAHF